MVTGMIGFIHLYQKYISPLKQPSCRFYPSCSDYAIQAIEKYGFFTGIRKSLIRIFKCHPFHPGGHDPI
ncbi:MAG: membrane protein insertion efficiency factor YidD [Desulfitobacteriaceae bacterium]